MGSAWCLHIYTPLQQHCRGQVMLECVSREIASAGYIVGLTLGDGRRNNVSREMSSAGYIVGLILGGGRRANVSREMSSAGYIVGLILGGGRRMHKQEEAGCIFVVRQW